MNETRNECSGGDLAPSLGVRTNFSRTKISESQFFRKKCPFSRPKFRWPFFSHRSGFPDFPFLYDVKCRIRPFSHKKNHWETTISEKNSFMTHFLICSCFRAHPTTLLLKILGGQMYGPSPTSHFGWNVPPVPHRSPPLHRLQML